MASEVPPPKPDWTIVLGATARSPSAAEIGRRAGSISTKPLGATTAAIRLPTREPARSEVRHPHQSLGRALEGRLETGWVDDVSGNGESPGAVLGQLRRRLHRVRGERAGSSRT